MDNVSDQLPYESFTGASTGFNFDFFWRLKNFDHARNINK